MKKVNIIIILSFILIAFLVSTKTGYSTENERQLIMQSESQRPSWINSVNQTATNVSYEGGRYLAFYGHITTGTIHSGILIARVQAKRSLAEYFHLTVVRSISAATEQLSQDAMNEVNTSVNALGSLLQFNFRNRMDLYFEKYRNGASTEYDVYIRILVNSEDLNNLSTRESRQILEDIAD